MALAENMARLRSLAEEIARPVNFMEVCGTHTMSAFRTGLRSMLPENVRLLSGPGCPVCVTPASFIDQALAIARQPDVSVATFGDMMRVPGTESSLEQVKARGGNVRVVYSPMDALAEARRQTARRIVFLGAGFETTAPAVACTLQQARKEGLNNFSVLCAHKLIPPAMAALLASGEVRINGFLCPGHVSVIIGAQAYEFICRDYGIPCAVAGFEARDMAEGLEMLLRQLSAGRAEAQIQYRRSVDTGGNPAARAVTGEVFEIEDESLWRGLGAIPGSGLIIRGAYAAHDAAKVFAGLDVPAPREPPGCRCGDVLKGAASPPDCPLFGKRCTPENPAGACMVSSEGTCAAYYKYARRAAAS